MDIYKWIWSKVSDRPFTYSIREGWKNFEFFWIVGLVSLGVWLGHSYGMSTILKGWFLFSLGYLCGHLFWSTTKEEWNG